MATQKEIAERLNISQQAVSASLGNRTGTVKVAPETRERVLSAARQFGYVPNQMARSLKSGKTGMIGVLMPFCKDPYYSALIDALNAEALKRKYSLLLQFHLWSGEDEEQAFQRLIGARVEGILSYPRSQNDGHSGIAALIKRRGIPVVALSAQAAEDLYTGVVEKDYEEEGVLLAGELIRKGHRTLDILAVASNHLTQQRRMQGVERAIAEAGVTVRARHVNLPPEMQAALSPVAPASEEVKNRLVTQLAEYYTGYSERGSAVLVGNEAVAWKIMSLAHSRGIAVPHDLSVVCSGTLGGGDNGQFPLTAAEYDVAEIASHALDLLSATGGRRVRVRPRLMIRNSVATLAASGGRMRAGSGRQRVRKAAP